MRLAAITAISWLLQFKTLRKEFELQLSPMTSLSPKVEKMCVIGFFALSSHLFKHIAQNIMTWQKMESHWNLTNSAQWSRKQRKMCRSTSLYAKGEFIQSRTSKECKTTKSGTTKCVSIVFRKPAFKYNVLHILQATASTSKVAMWWPTKQQEENA